MKTTSAITSGLRPPSHHSLRIRFKAVLSSIWVAGAALIGPSGGDHLGAAVFPPGPDNEATNTLAALRVTVLPGNAYLMEPNLPMGRTRAFTGWNNVASTLTSPMLSDRDTRIGVSAVQVDPPAFGGGIQVGIAGVDTLGRGLSPLWVVGNPDPNYFILDGPGAREVFTEIQRFDLNIAGFCNTNDPRMPDIGDLVALLPFTLVKAGRDNGLDRPSVGLARSTTGVPANDFPAKSFFDIFVEVILPPIPNTASFDYFPAGGAVLTNDNALIVAAAGLMSLPPATVYTHEPPIDSIAGDPWPVNLIFRDDCLLINPATGAPYYRGGDVFGSVELAGHGTFPCGAKSTASDFIDQVFGKPGQLAPGAVQGYSYPDAKFPWPTSAYDSAKGTNFDGRSLDAVKFTNAVSGIFVRELSLGGFDNPMDLPPMNSSVIYSNLNIAASLQISTDTNTFYPATATGQVQISIVHTNPPYSNNATKYAAQIMKWDLTGSYINGSFKIRQSPTKASLGKHVVQALPSGGYRIGGYFDAVLEYSINNGATYRPADRPIRLQLANPPCGEAVAKLNISLSGSVATIRWENSLYRLQGAVTLDSGWVTLPATSAYAFNLPSNYRFFRLVCP